MRIHTLVLTLALAPAAGLVASDDVLHLAVGDPARRDREARLALDAITDARTGALLTPAQLAASLLGVRVVFIGESHTDMEFHRAQLRLIEELHRTGRQVLIGLEMYPYTEQAALDRWNQEPLTEEGFVRVSRWYKNWGYHWQYYRDIFLFARQAGIRLFAVNTPREVVTAVRKKGLEHLTEEEAAHIPARIDTDNPEHLRLFKAFFGEGDAVHSPSMSEAQWQAMFAAQCTWDATMGYNAVQALKAHGRPDSIMVVLIGSGHVAYGLGIQRQAAHWFDGRMASVIPVPIVDAKQQPVETVRASYADFLWGVAKESAPLFPVLGVSTREVKESSTLEVIAVERDSVGAQSGFATGDVFVSMDGAPVRDKEALNSLMATRRWSDTATVTVRRGEQDVTLAVHFRRKPPDARPPAPPR